jgi:hypothetical protein
MRKATETLVQTTWLADNSIFACHDHVTDIDWNSVWDDVSDGKYNERQITLISVLAYLASNRDLDSVGLPEIGDLEQMERIAVLDALRIHWAGVQLQEDL